MRAVLFALLAISGCAAVSPAPAALSLETGHPRDGGERSGGTQLVVAEGHTNDVELPASIERALHKCSGSRGI